jgi:hypothetical protein
MVGELNSTGIPSFISILISSFTSVSTMLTYYSSPSMPPPTNKNKTPINPKKIPFPTAKVFCVASKADRTMTNDISGC